MIFFDRIISIRLRDDELEAVQKIIDQHPTTYDSISHFFRVAAIKEINHKKGEKQ